MIRLVQRKLILPRGDTGSLTIPVLPNFNTGDIAVFAIFNPLNKTIIFKKQIEIVDNKITIQFSHNDTVNLPAGKYLWDIKAYLNPIYADGELVNGDQIDSYYASYKLPECQIRETADSYLMADDAPTSTLSPNQLDLLSTILAELRDAVQKSQENVSHYPVIINEEWYTWNTDTNQYVGTGVRVPARISDLIDDSGHYTKPINGIPANDIADGVIPNISVKADKVPNATSGNFASLDANGNLVDSGHKHSDYLTEHQDISGKQDVLTFDDAPQLISNNPVKSSGLWNAFNSVNSDITFINSQISSLQNQVIGKQDLLYFDTQPKANSNHPVTSGGIKTAIDTAISTKQDTLIFDVTPTQLSNNPVTSSGIKSALSGLEWSLSERANMIDDRVDDLENDIAGHTMDISLLESNITNLETNKQDTLTFDNTPTANSINPVTSNGIKVALDLKANVSSMPTKVSDLDNDSGYLTSHQDITGKTDKVANATNGNFAALDANGNLTDSGSKASDFLTTHQDISGKADKVTNGTNGNFIALDSNGNLADSGHKHSDYLTSHQDISGKTDKVTSATNGNFAALDANGNLTDSGSKASDFLTSHQTIPVTDVQVNGTSVLNNGVANVPFCTGSNSPGVVAVNSDYGVSIATSGGAAGKLYLSPPSNAQIKSGSNQFKPIVPSVQHTSIFYGLAKAAGDTTQASSSNAVGTYTEDAQSKIHEMLDAPVTVSGTDPVIACKAGMQYVCGEVSTLSITLPASGIVDIIFESGSTPTVLSGLSSINWASGFDPTNLDANATYELNVKGSLGVAVKWT